MARIKSASNFKSFHLHPISSRQGATRDYCGTPGVANGDRHKTFLAGRGRFTIFPIRLFRLILSKAWWLAGCRGVWAE
jgi:hypothetical protein